MHQKMEISTWYIKLFKNDINNFRLYFSLHGVWFAPQWLAARAAYRFSVPAVLSPHGMLEVWHWRKNFLKRIKKLVYWHTLAYKAFRHLNVIHALTSLERDNLAKYFPKQNIVVIPNAIDLDEVDRNLIDYGNSDSPLDKPYILFVARLDPQKGLDILIDAFSLTKNPGDFHLLIVGPVGIPKYVEMLKNQVKKLDLDKKILFIGPVFGNKKWNFYRHAWAFCTPSRSEGLSAVHLEAASAQVPVITTYNSGIEELERAGGLLVNPRADELAKALEKVFSWSENERNERGRAMRKLVERRYSWDVVGPQYLSLYSELLKSG